MVRISWKEVEAIVRLWRSRTGADASVDLDSVARSLGISEAEAADMLNEVRQSRRPFVDRSGVWSAGLAGAAAACALAFHFSQKPTHSVEVAYAGSAPIAAIARPAKVSRMIVVRASGEDGVATISMSPDPQEMEAAVAEAKDAESEARAHIEFNSVRIN